MKNQFLCGQVLPEITKAARQFKKPCKVAVPYFAKGGHRLLPLSRGSKLVVNASESTVRSGQTSPHDLSQMMRRGVRVFSNGKLHAKVFLFGKTAYIGSSNVSHNSAQNLIEATIRTNDPHVVKEVYKFISDLLIHELTPEHVKELSKIYNPPKFQGLGHRKKTLKRSKWSFIDQPRIRVINLEDRDRNDLEKRAFRNGKYEAQEFKKNSKEYAYDDFTGSGKLAYNIGDRVVQVLDTGKKEGTFVYPPGYIYHIRKEKDKKGIAYAVFVQRTKGKRLKIRYVAKKIGRGSLKILDHDHIIRSQPFSHALLKLWS
jgi:hypothetical protein